MIVSEKELLAENILLREEIAEYKDLVEGIRNGGVDALAINKNGHADIFSLESSDFVYRVLVENFPEGALNISDKGIIVYANPAFELLVGTGNTSIVGMDFISLVDKHSKWVYEKMFRDAFSGTSSGELMIRYREKEIHVEVSLSSLYPRFHGIGILIKDLSEKRKKEEQLLGYKKQLIVQEEQLLETKILQRSIDKFRFMGDTVPQKVWTAGSTGEFDYFNKKWLEYSYLSSEELKGSGWMQMLHPDDREETEKKWSDSVESGAVYETEHRLQNHKGAYRWHLSRAVAQHDETGNIIMWVGTTTDVHEQKNFTNELENRVNEAKVFLKTIFDSSEEVIASMDHHYIFTSVNKIAESYFGLESDKIVGKSLFSLLPELKDGSYHKMLQSVLEGTVVHQKETVMKDGQEAVFDAFFKPLILHNHVKGIVIVARDITQVTSVTRNLQKTKKQLEEQFANIASKNKQLLASNAELIGFNYIASHDLQEPLRKIMVFSGRVLDRATAATAEVVVDLKRVCSAAAHMKNLLDALLNYSKINVEDYKFVSTDMNELMRTVKRQIDTSYPNRQAVIGFSDLPVIDVIPYQIGQLFTNLLTNSIKYCRDDVTPRITIVANRLSSDQLPDKEIFNDVAYWKFTVSDNGIGFEQKYAGKIFELFQRLHTKDIYEGTGIGLAICRKVMQNHNGVIIATGAPDQGATFDLYLPVEQNISNRNDEAGSEIKTTMI